MNTENIAVFADVMEGYKKDYLADLPAVFDNLESQLLKLEKAKIQEDSLAELYRSVHNLKGSAGSYDLAIISNISHQLEDLLADYSNSSTETYMKYIDLMRQALQEAINSENPNFISIESELYKYQKSLTKNKLLGVIVDASRHNTLMLQQILRPCSIKLTVMNDGLVALSRLLFVKYDLLIISKEIPSLSGTALVNSLRTTNCLNKNIKIIMLSSNEIDNNQQLVGPDCKIVRDKHFDTNIIDAVQKVLPEAVKSS